MSLLDPTQRQIMKEQKAFLKDKSFKYKLKYFVDYYLLDVGIVLLFLIIIGSLIYTSATHKDVAAQIVFINAINSPEADEFSEFMGLDLKKSEAIFDTSVYINVDMSDSSSYVNVQKLFALIAAEECDVIVGDPKTMTFYGDSEFYADLRNVFTESELEALGDKIVWYDLCDEEGNKTGESAPFFVNVTDMPGIQDSNVYMGLDAYLAFVVNTKRPEAQEKFWEYINR